MNTALFSLAGRDALITGGGTGIGRQVALSYAAAGARVILCARRIDKLQQTVEEIRNSGGSADCVAMDVTDAASVDAAFERACAERPVSIVVNNAGITSSQPLHELEESEWDQVLDTNLKGAWLVTRAAARRMIAGSTGGSIINVASILGFTVQKGTGPYAASKAGLIHMTQVMAHEWARYGIRVNALAPGYVATDIAGDYLSGPGGQALLKRIPQRRLGTVDDMIGAMLLLASDASAYMTGSVICVDGGLSLAGI